MCRESGLSLGAWESFLGDNIESVPIHSVSSDRPRLSLSSVRPLCNVVQTIIVRPEESSPVFILVLSPKLVPPVSTELNAFALLMVDSRIFCGHRPRVDAALVASASIVVFSPTQETRAVCDKI